MTEEEKFAIIMERMFIKAVRTPAKPEKLFKSCSVQGLELPVVNIDDKDDIKRGYDDQDL